MGDKKMALNDVVDIEEYKGRADPGHVAEIMQERYVLDKAGNRVVLGPKEIMFEAEQARLEIKQLQAARKEDYIDSIVARSKAVVQAYENLQPGHVRSQGLVSAYQRCDDYLKALDATAGRDSVFIGAIGGTPSSTPQPYTGAP